MAILQRQFPSLSKTPESRQTLGTQGIINPTPEQLRTQNKLLWTQTRGLQRQFPQQPTDLYEATRQKLEAKYGTANVAGAKLFGSMLQTPQQLSAIPGFTGMTLQGAERMQGIKEGGQGRMLDILGRISEERRTQAEKLAEEQTKMLSQRRQSAIKEYMDFKQRIINEGGTPDLKAGHDLINKIQQSENPEVELSDYFSVAAPFVQKLFAPKKMGGGSGDGTIASVNLYSDIMQQAINAGATTPDEVVAGIQAVASTSGVNLSIKDLNAIKDKAKALLSSKKMIPELPQQPISSIEQDIAQLKKGNILKDSDIRYALKKRGYSTQEINQSSIGGIIDSISSYIFGE